MKIALFGATGRTGRYILDQALADGHRVTVLARNPSKLPPGKYSLTIQLGDVLDACLLYTSPSPRDRTRSRMPSSA